MTSMEDYLGRVQALVWSLADILDGDQRARVQHLVDHGEPAEAMCSLAWIIVREDKYVPATTIASIRELSEGLVAEQDMPPTLDSHGLPDP